MGKTPSLASRIYRALIKLYPSDFRFQHGPEMKRFYDEAEQEEGGRPGGLLTLWSHLLLDFFRTLPREHLDILRQDCRFSLRSLGRNPGFAVAAISTLAIAIAANTAIYSVVQSVLISPLPYQNPDQLVLIRSDLPKIGLRDAFLSEPEVLDLRQNSQLFSEFGVIVSSRVNLTTEQSVEPISTGLVSANFMDLLGVRPLLGRSFRPEEETPNGPAAAILSHAFWVNRMGGDPTVLGELIEIDGREIPIVGVASETFRPRFPSRTRLPAQFDLWLPYQIDYAGQDRHAHGITVLGRMRPGVSVSAAQSELDALSAQLESQWYPDSGFGFTIHPFQQDLTAEARLPLLALGGAVLLVLLITCANIANLLLARNSVRSREISIRSAMGARTTRLARQILTEGLVLSLLGGMLGTLLAWLSLPALKALIPASIPGVEAISLSGSVLGFALMCCGLAAILFSLSPTFQALRQNRALSRNLSARGAGSEAGLGLRRLLIVAEITLAFLLLVGGGLMLRTLIALEQEVPGYQPDGVLTFQISLPSSSYTRDEVAPFFAELERRLSALPGVQAVGANMQLPLSGSSWSGTDTFYDTTNGQTTEEKEHLEVDQRVITPGYFTTLGTALREGRFFGSEDHRQSQPVIIIDETLAERIWPGVSPIGRKMARGADPENPFFFEVVGVVGHQRYHDVRSDGRPQVYYAQSQLRFNSLSLAVKSSNSSEALLAPIRATLREMDPELAIDRVRTLSSLVETTISRTRFTLQMIGFFAGIGLFLACLGIFGVVNYSVNRQKREIAIRMAMGDRPAEILRSEVGRAIALGVIGVLLGTVAGLAVSRMLQALLFGVSAWDLPTFLTVAALCLGFAVAASLIPAYRATRVDQAVVLKGD